MVCIFEPLFSIYVVKSFENIALHDGTVYSSFNQCFLGIEENSPLGKDWSTVDAEPMKHVSYKKFHF